LHLLKRIMENNLRRLFVGRIWFRLPANVTVPGRPNETH
jgi:hypothetical protein